MGDPLCDKELGIGCGEPGEVATNLTLSTSSRPAGTKGMTLDDAIECAIRVLSGYHLSSYERKSAIRLTRFLRQRRTQKTAARVRAFERRADDAEVARFRAICS